MNSRIDLRGVGGWLALLVLLMCVIGPLKIVGETGIGFAEMEQQNRGLSTLSEWAAYRQRTWMLVFCTCAALVFGGWRLWTVHRPSSVYIAIAVLWSVYVIGVAGHHLIAVSAFGEEFAKGANIGGETAIALIKGLVSPTVRSAYLLISRRVKNTYFHEYRPYIGGRERIDPVLKNEAALSSGGDFNHVSLQRYEVLLKLKSLLDSGAITQSEYETEKAKILGYKG